MHILRSVTALHSARRGAKLISLKYRHFHSTEPRQGLVEIALNSSSAVVHGVHTVSCLPWVASIPLTAILVRFGVGFPLQSYSRLRVQEEKQLQPLLAGWNTYSHIRGRGSDEKREIAAKALQKQTKALYRKWHVSTWYRPIMFLQIPVFLSFMESLRVMSGNKQGLYAWLVSQRDPSETASAADTLTSSLEPSFATEGALWFPDLLAGDHTGILPALLTASILANVVNGWKAKPLKELAELPKIAMYREVTFRGLRVFIQVLACQVGLMSFVNELPAALLLYWITSTNVATLQSWFLEKKVFARPKPKPFKRLYVGYEIPGKADPFQLKNLR